jgi:hypothetical protein
MQVMIQRTLRVGGAEQGGRSKKQRAGNMASKGWQHVVVLYSYTAHVYCVRTSIITGNYNSKIELIRPIICVRVKKIYKLQICWY